MASVSDTARKLTHPEHWEGSVRCMRKEVTQESNERRNPHHGLADEGEDSKQSNGLGAKMHHVDLVMGKHRIEEGGKGGN